MATLSSEVDPRDVAHIACDCVPDIGPEHCHLCSERAGHPVPWSECSAQSALLACAIVAAKAQALRDAAYDWEETPDRTPRTGTDVGPWLRARATAIGVQS